MKMIKISFYIGLLLCEKSFKSYTAEAAHIRQFNSFYQPALQIDETEFSMFPLEDVTDFPEIDSSEDAPQALEEYYASVAQAYRTWGERQKDLVNACKMKALSYEGGLFWKGTKPSASSVTQAHAQAIKYYEHNFQIENYRLQLLEKKADFYQKVAEEYKFIMDS